MDKNEREFTIGQKVSKKSLVDYHDNPSYDMWDADAKKWRTVKLADRLPNDMRVVETKQKDNAVVIRIEGDTKKVVWVEVPNGKSKKTISIVYFSNQLYLP